MLQEKTWVLETRTPPTLGGNVRPIELRSFGGFPDELGSPLRLYGVVAHEVYNHVKYILSKYSI
ncbi:hypothetical protein NIES4106_30490 [Fischerella sp. NIES-4106]|jgi:hypothetical protein|nr:hypothetical protein NIES4106_30490 [Fischerella sp. NIES-4106]